MSARCSLEILALLPFLPISSAILSNTEKNQMIFVGLVTYVQQIFNIWILQKRSPCTITIERLTICYQRA